MPRFPNFARKLRRDRRGNVMLITALSLPVMIGFGGFGIDMAQWYMWKRELQHSVDQAAYAGAYAMAHKEKGGTYTVRAQQEYAANLQQVSSFASQPSIVLANYANGIRNSVVVTASASKPLPFSSFITKSATTVTVVAQARFKQGVDFRACLISLAEDGTGTEIGGNAYVNARCGVAALSCDPDEPAIQISGSATVIADIIVACGTIDAPSQDPRTLIEGVPLTDTYKDLSPPTDNRARTNDCTGSGKNKQANLQPGTYKGLVVKCNTVLQTGIYVIDGGTLDLAGNYTVTGTNVMFILKNGALMKMGGSGGNGSIRLTPMSSADFRKAPYTAYASQADRLSNILVFEDRNSKVAEPGHILNGNSNSLIEGLIYLPQNTLRVNGTADVSSQCLRVSAYRLKILGNANLETLCPTADSTLVGAGLPEVRLVR